MKYNRSLIKIVHACITLVIFVAALELSVHIYVSIFEDRYVFRDFSQFVLDRERRSGVENQYSPELGWDFQFPTPFGERQRPVSYEEDFISTFGDSFTAGNQLRHTETWQTKLSAMLGRNVFNFGITAYGTDQALLRYLRDHKKVKVKISILSFIPENMNRLANVYRGFYFKLTRMPATKPYFTVENGEVVLNKNPIQRKDDVRLLMNKSFLAEIAKDDYWAKNILKRPERKFPYIKLLFDPDFRAQSKDIIFGKDTAKYSEIRPSDDLWKDPYYVEIMKHIFALYVEEAEKSDEIPILILLPQGENISAVLMGRPYPGETVFRNECEERGYRCFIPADFMANKIGTIDRIPQYYFRSGKGHPTPKGAQLIAEAIYRFLTDNRLLENGSLKPRSR